MLEIERRMHREKQKRKKHVTKVNVQAGPTRDAYRKMKLSGWAWTPKHCGQCGGKLSRQRWKTCAHRGFGRLFFRCQDCEQYWDVLVSVVRLPLLVVWRLLELYFDHCPVLSAQAIGRSLSCSASPAQQALDSKNLGSEKQNTRCENKCRTFAFALQHVAQA